jgi:hypothetical protein
MWPLIARRKGQSVNQCLLVLARAGRLVYTAIPSEVVREEDSIH